ncbi:helix-hairpin-helix domain-containing protein [Neobacillus sp. 114]|uniref:helix-hairpin-helix domain-containing protein n=1 Tax=Neobacillus sp. 114 TaxID=3048535 RepID=UPI0024C2CD87|nr:helix-hairpin-helix domain-containing protein [Neobacillus sp. 114]
MKDWLMEHKSYAVAVALLVVVLIFYFYQNGASEAIQPQPLATDKVSEAGRVQEKSEENMGKTQSQTAAVIMVDVKGQVKQPGVYKASEGERVIDVVSRAGGVTEQAEQGQVNFAERVKDEMVIYIPAKGEGAVVLPEASGNGVMVSGGTGQNEGKINLNKADVNELQNLPGIGPAKAAAIIDYRETSGPFKQAEDLKNVSGIGEKTYEKIKDLVTAP